MIERKFSFIGCVCGVIFFAVSWVLRLSGCCAAKTIRQQRNCFTVCRVCRINTCIHGLGYLFDLQIIYYRNSLAADQPIFTAIHPENTVVFFSQSIGSIGIQCQHIFSKVKQMISRTILEICERLFLVVLHCCLSCT